jgi:hypothetical protein
MRWFAIGLAFFLFPPPTQQGEVVATDLARDVGIYEVTTSWSIAAADYDGDGFSDFLLGRHLRAARLYRNEGDLGFVEVERGSFEARDRHDCAWSDVDQDGLLDIYCSIGAEHGTATKANELWIQQLDHSFVNRAEEFGVNDPYGRGRRVTFIDANHDAYPDLFVGNLYPRQDGVASPNRLFINRRGTRFRDAREFGLTEEVGAGCAQAADYDGDGWQDLLVCGAQALHLYRNEDGRSFRDVSSSVGIGGRTRSAQLVDVDGDGRLDLVQSQRHTVSVRLQRGDVFRDPTYSWLLEAGARIAVGDVDRDARPDLYLVVGCGSSSQNLPDVMLVNRGDAGFESVEIPQVRGGCGDVAAPADYDMNGTTDFIVTNGRGFVHGRRATGPVQLISFSSPGGMIPAEVRAFGVDGPP